MTFYREPLFHFLLVGIAVFGWFTYLNPASETPDSEGQIVIDEQDVDRLIEQFKTTWQRQPTADELVMLQDNLLREEVLVREARALGLDRGDSIVRNRLAQKMDFLTTSLAQSVEPDDKVLRDHLAENKDRFMLQGKVAFRQIGFGADADPANIEAAAEALNNGADPATFGSASLLPSALPLTSAQQIDGAFGRGFSDALSDLSLNKWAGPVRSGYGLHLVRVDARQNASLPPLEDIRDDVLFDWRRELKSELSRAQFEELKSGYDITALTRDQLAERVSQ